MASSRRSTAVRDGTIVPAAAGFNNTDWARVAKALPHSLLPTVTARLRSATTMRKDCVHRVDDARSLAVVPGNSPFICYTPRYYLACRDSAGRRSRRRRDAFCDQCRAGRRLGAGLYARPAEP